MTTVSHRAYPAPVAPIPGPPGESDGTLITTFDGVAVAPADSTVGLQAAIDATSAAGGGVLRVPIAEFYHTGLTAKSNVVLRGEGPGSRLHNTSTTGAHAIGHTGGVRGGVVGFGLENLRLSGNAQSGDGLHLNGYSSPFTVTATTGYAYPCEVRRCTIDGHGGRGVYLAAGDKAAIRDSYIHSNGLAGVYVDGTLVGSNTTSIQGCAIERNGNWGVRVVWVASCVAVTECQINENTDGGVQWYAVDTAVCRANGFNQNTGPAVKIGGVKQNGLVMRLVEGGQVENNIFGDNGTGAMVQVHDARAVNIDNNTFYKVGEPGESSCISLEGLIYGVRIGPGNEFFGTTDPKACIADDDGTLTDQTAAAQSSTTNDLTLLPAVPAEDDAYYFGANEKFSVMHLQQGVQGAGTWTIAWEYWNGSAWSGLASHTISDSISAFTGTVGYHQIRFRLPIDWATTTVGTKTAFFIRARVSAFTSITTQPLGTNCWFLTRPRTILDVSQLSEGYYTFCDTDADEGSLLYRHHSSTAIPLATQVEGEQFRRWQIRESGEMSFGGGTTTFDAVIKRAAAAVISVTRLGVGNSSASTPDVTGSAKVRKIQVFDDSGVSIGYLQVYAGPGV